MANLAVKVENISKKYQLGLIGTSDLRSTLVEGAKWLAGKRKKLPIEEQEFWALRDISFEVPQGGVVGVIGRNGAGKSTLLKVLSKITQPSSGRITLNGRVASLLEVGTGFHPELTGRENIYLNGSILGMSKTEIKNKFDAIVDFSGVEKFLDTPVKRYSSGMYVRLAFSVAAHLEPEVLVIDEVLSVGDADFQRKCLGKMGEVAQGGRTILFVSHNMAAVKSLCNSAILIDKGQLMYKGDTESAISQYMGSGSISSIVRWAKGAEPCNQFVKLHELQVRARGKKEGESITMRDEIEISIEFEKYKEGVRFDTTLQIVDEEGRILFPVTSADNQDEDPRNLAKGVFKNTCYVPADFFNQGRFYANLLIIENRKHLRFQEQSILSFDIIPAAAEEGRWMGKSKGSLRPRFDWKIDKMA